jgi:L-alanine-DL-glutamate epimerase-like enolase superfamily enzyme
VGFKGKILKQPVYKLLGGSYRKEFLTYGGFGLYGGTVSVEDAVKKALNLAEKGFRVIKLRMQIREYNLNPVPDFTVKYYTMLSEKHFRMMWSFLLIPMKGIRLQGPSKSGKNFRNWE